MDELMKLVMQSYGLVGLVLVSPMIAMVFLWRDNKKLQREVVAAQTQRVTDAQQVTEKLIEMVSEHAGLAKETNIALDRIAGLLTTLQK